jgi:hypothetical protein
MVSTVLRIALLCSVLLLSACAQLPDGASRLAQSQQLLQTKGWQRRYLQAGDFRLFSAGPVAQAAGNQPITAYLEGDGLAWLNSDTPSDDPTPLRPWVCNWPCSSRMAWLSIWHGHASTRNPCPHNASSGGGLLNALPSRW